MKKCAFCNAEMEDNAVKCEYCGQECETLNNIKPVIENKPMPKKRRRRNSAWSIVLCVFLAIGVFLSALSGTAFVLLGNAVNGRTIETVVESTDILSIPVGEGTVLDKVEEVLKESGNETLAALDTEEIRSIAENAGLNDALADLLDQATGYITGEYENIEISTEQIMVILEDNVDNIYEATGYRITESDLTQIEQSITEQAEVINEAATQMMADPVMQTTVSTVRFAVGPTVPTVSFVITGLCVVIMILILRRKEGVFMYTGIPVLLIGVLLGVVYATSSTLKAFLFAAVPLSATVQNIVDTVVGVILDPVLYAAVIAAVVGVVCIVLYIVIFNLIKKSKKYAG